MDLNFHIPTRPFSPIDALNRRAAAVGSPRYATQAAHADYNGHFVHVSWNSYRGYYVAEYTWAGRRVLARGSLESCVAAAIAEQDRGALGASVAVSVREDDQEGLLHCQQHPRLTQGQEPKTLPWRTWRHVVAARSVKDHCLRGQPTVIFDWELMQAAADEQDYLAKLRVKYGADQR